MRARLRSAVGPQLLGPWIKSFLFSQQPIRLSELGNILKAKYISSKSRRITGMPNSGFQRHCVAELNGYYYIIGRF